MLHSGSCVLVGRIRAATTPVRGRPWRGAYHVWSSFCGVSAGCLPPRRKCLPPGRPECERVKLLVNTRYADRAMQDANAFT